MVWCGYDGVFATPSAASLATVEKYAQYFTVVAMPHSGLEYQPAPDAIKTTFYRGLIDNGADVVIGNHAHWVQTSEAYKGHLILYSLGNFIFDQQFSSEVTRSAVLSISASITALDAPDLDKWLALGSQCKTYNDTCLQQATDQKLQKLPLQLHFSILGSVDAGKVTHRANDEQVNAIKQRLQWAQTIGGLSGQYSGE
jgi:poly-gamma-glutamate synthesis protein (capsule biosynthesis protein)